MGAEKKMSLWRLPNYLIIQLKRFSQEGYYRERLDTMVNFPVEGLDMTEHVHENSPFKNQKEKFIYDLYGVANHMGSASFGHYTAYCKSESTRGWKEYNDSSVTQVTNPQSVVTYHAYVLFYRRRGSPICPPTPKVKTEEPPVPPSLSPLAPQEDTH